MSSSHQIQPGMAVSKHFESWMERATAEFFDKLASIKQPVAGNRFLCRVGPKDVFFIEYGDPKSLLQALMCLWTNYGGLHLIQAEGDTYGSTWISCGRTAGLDAGILPLLCVCVRGLTYSILINQVALPSRNGFQQVSWPYDWDHEYNKKQQSRVNEGTQSATGDSKEAAAHARDLGSTTHQASQSVNSEEDEALWNDEGL